MFILVALFFLLLPVQDDIYKKNNRMIHSIHLWERGKFSEELKKYEFNVAMNKRSKTVLYPLKFKQQPTDIHENPFEVLFKRELRQYPSSYFSSEFFSYSALLSSERIDKVLNVSRLESGRPICLSISSQKNGAKALGGKISLKERFLDAQSNLFHNTSNCNLNLEETGKTAPGISFIPWHHQLADYDNLRKKNLCNSDIDCLKFCQENYVGRPFGDNQFLNLFIAKEVCVVVKLVKNDQNTDVIHVRGCYRNESVENFVKVVKENIISQLGFRILIREETDPILKAISISQSSDEPYVLHISNFQMMSKIFFSIGACLLIILATLAFYWKIKAKESNHQFEETQLIHDISVNSRSTAVAMQSLNISEIASNSNRRN